MRSQTMVWSLFIFCISSLKENELRIFEFHSHLVMVRGLRGLFSLWCGCTVLLVLIFFIAPPMEVSISPFVKSKKDLQKLADEVVFYQYTHPFVCLCLFSLLYLYKQSFAIPGSFLLNLLAGAMYHTLNGTFLICVLTTIGASFCYLISSHFAKAFATGCFSKSMKSIKDSVTDDPRTLFFYLLSVRLIPFTPHWLFNACSPFAGVPLKIHALTVAIGMIPYNFLCVRAGSLMFEFHSWSDVFITPHVFFLIALAGGANFMGRYIQRPQPSLPRTAQ